MAAYFVSNLTSTTATVSPAVAGKRIRIRRLIISTSINGSIEFKQDVGGPSEAIVLPQLEARATGPALDLAFERELPQTAPGLALGYESAIAGEHGIWVEYDVVD